MRLFLDANVLFSAAWQDGRARAMFALGEPAAARILTSAHAREEARRNLEAKRPEALPQFEALLEHVSVVPEPPSPMVEKARALGLPLNDAPILAAAWAAGADVLVTGDRRHFGRWMGEVVEGVLVLPPRAALEQLLARIERDDPRG